MKFNWKSYLNTGLGIAAGGVLLGLVIRFGGTLPVLSDAAKGLKGNVKTDGNPFTFGR